MLYPTTLDGLTRLWSLIVMFSQTQDTALLLRHVQLPAKDLAGNNTTLDLLRFQVVFPDN